MNSITTYNLLNETLEKMSLEKILNRLYVHKGTLNRWLNQRKVPNNYFNDLNHLLDNKYKPLKTYRNQDQFYTTKEISKYCYDKTLKILKDLKIDITQYNFIEPSAGCCNFYSILPKDRRVGIDIEPKGILKKEIIKSNYLDFYPNPNKKYIVIGNPPFGLRGNLALRFINHSYSFANIVAFILPPLFDSTGKGVPANRVKGYKLAYNEKLPLNSFEYPDGKKVNIATRFQIWSKININNIKIEKKQSCKSIIRIYSLSNGGTPSSTRNKKMLNKCDIYLPSTCFKGMKVYDTFEELPNKRGYGVIFLKYKDILIEYFKKDIKWEKIAFLSTNSALNLRTDIIENVVLQKGYNDE
jgi:hypothetical protein